MSSPLASPPGLPMPEIIADPRVAPLLFRCYPLFRPLFRPLLPAVPPAVIPLFFGYKT